MMPAPGGRFHGPTVHSLTGIPVTPGTLSQYRRLDARFELNANVAGYDLRLVDNLLELRFHAARREDAFTLGVQVVDRFLKEVALRHGRCFTATVLFLEDEQGELVPLPMTLFSGTVTVFDLSALREQVEQSISRLTITDEALEKATDYYQHALYLHSATPEADFLPFTSRTASHLTAASFLFLWKALSVVVGDPSVDRDYQRRYRDMGLDHEFFKDTIEEIRRLRNEEDVAHYRLDAGGLVKVREAFARAKLAVREVIDAYALRLASR